MCKAYCGISILGDLKFETFSLIVILVFDSLKLDRVSIDHGNSALDICAKHSRIPRTQLCPADSTPASEMLHIFIGRTGELLANYVRSAFIQGFCSTIQHNSLQVFTQPGLAERATHSVKVVN